MAKKPLALEIRFESKQAFEHEYANNIANGGIFIATDTPLEVRRRVKVRVKLAYLGKGVDLRGEIVHVVPAELATSGATPGVAVQFEAPAAELRERFEPLLACTEPDVNPVVEDRRGAPRGRARARARVVFADGEAAVGRTRDLSVTGVLISIPNPPRVEVGSPVTVTIANPETGHECDVPGRIARHVAGDGGVVRALAVRFNVTDADRRPVEQFLRKLRATEHSRHLGGIQGDIAELGLAGLIQTLGLAASEGTLDVMKGADEGFLAFESGSLRAAELGGARGIKALARMLSWTEGSFEFHARIDVDLPDGDCIPLDGALLEAMRLLDESADVDRDGFPLDAELSIDEAARDAADDLSKLDETILVLAATGMNVQQILDTAEQTDAEIYTALWNLWESGIISISDP